jgi:outer membrane protein assembly factor BamB
VYTLGAEGHLFCFDLSDGKVVWSKELKKEYKTKSALWGYAGHPLIDGDHLITLAGGAGSHLVALDKSSGKEVWKSLTSVEQGYSPPTIIEAGGTRQLITLCPDAVTSVDPATGKEFWSIPYEATSNSIIMSPIKIGDYLFAGGYSNKSILLKLDPDRPAATEVWRDRARSAVSPINVQPFLDIDKKIVYGMDQNGDLRATRFPDAELLWATSKPVSQRRVGNGTAFIVRQGSTDRFWLFNENGELIIAKLTPDGYDEIDRAKVIETSNNAFNRPVVWSMPAFANRHVYIRNDNEIVCVDLAKQ